MKNLIYIIFLLTIMQSCISPLGDKVNGNKSSSYYYQPITGNIIYSPGGNWFERAYEKVNADRNSFKPFSNYSGKDKKMVFYEYYPQPQVDVRTFIEENNVMKDKQNVYSVSDHLLVPIIGADPNSFVYLEPNSTNSLIWAKDNLNYYMHHKKVKVDYNSFCIVYVVKRKWTKLA